jgi:HEPN domain-containing protein
MQEITSEWVFKAEQDIDAADLLMHAGEAPIPDYVCFHCQQCAEKYLKAYLQEYKVEFERTHDLSPLLELCIALDKEFERLYDDIRELDRYAVIVRYPGIRIDAKTAKLALKQAGRVRTFVREKLKIG